MSQIAPPKDVTEIANDSVYGTHLRMLLKMNLRLQIDAKSAQLKIESMSSGVARKGAHKGAQEGASNVALKVTLLVALELHLFM